MNNQLVAYLQEIFLRLSTKSPKFFQIWGLVSGGVAAISGLPGLLMMLSIKLPHPYDNFANQTVAACATVSLFMTLLTTKSKPAALGENGEVYNQINEKKLPFSAKAEIKETNKIIAKEQTTTEPIAVQKIEQNKGNEVDKKTQG